jgi:hypothetical protein
MTCQPVAQRLQFVERGLVDEQLDLYRQAIPAGEEFGKCQAAERNSALIALLDEAAGHDLDAPAADVLLDGAAGLNRARFASIRPERRPPPGRRGLGVAPDAHRAPSGARSPR